MGIKQIIKSESDVVTRLPVKIPFEFKDLSSLPKDKNIGDCIVITPIKTRTWFKLKPLLLEIDKEDLAKLTAKDEPFKPEMIDVMNKYDCLLYDIVCIGIHNKNGDPPLWFRKVLQDNSTWEDIYILLNAIFFRLFHNPFSKSITLLKSVSPIGEEEIIALQRKREMWMS